MIRSTYFEKHEVCKNGKCKVRSKMCDGGRCTMTSSDKKVKKAKDHIRNKLKKDKAPVNLISFRGCSYCEKAKALLKKHKIPFREFSTVPQIYMMGERLGGYDNLKTFLD